MKSIKSYEDFCNEEINWKKALTGAAMASTLGGVTSCDEPMGKTPTSDNLSYEDSIKFQKYKDSTYNAIMNKIEQDKNKELDSIVKTESPIQVLSVKFIDDDYTQLVRVRYKNVSDKKIIAIKFKWVDFKDVFGDDVNLLYNGGVSEDIIKPGKELSGTWNIHEENVKTGKVYCEEVVFDDGSKWTLE